MLSNYSSHILLYHSTFSEIPADLAAGIHNVSPEEIYQQINWLKNNFDVVSIDELFSITDVRGKAAITFDDAYKSLFAEALPIFETLNIPCTIFINGCTLDQRVFWRDKVRYIINNSLVDDFIVKNLDFCIENKINVNNFYYQTKHRSISSITVDNLLDKYFQNSGIDLDGISYCIDNRDIFSANDLVSYGSHSYSHYVMSSLTKEQQSREILNNLDCFKKYDIKQSKVFSIPFGDESSFDANTICLLEQHGYTGFLYSRNRLNSVSVRKHVEDSASSMLIGDRYMPKSTFSSFQTQILALNFRKLLGI